MTPTGALSDLGTAILTPPTCSEGLSRDALERCLDLIGPHPVAWRLVHLALLVGALIGLVVVRRWKA